MFSQKPHFFSLNICISHGSGSRLHVVKGCLPGSNSLVVISEVMSKGCKCPIHLSYFLSGFRLLCAL